ncbi:MAG TPA: GEVED domain-containing protein [Verrucomicrobiota bacterium]|nr:GEVED domain-containing protein [Verrucomicrobiota bacterium]
MFTLFPSYAPLASRPAAVAFRAASLLAASLLGSTALAQAPAVAEINQYLIIGMKPQPGNEAVAIGSSQELGAGRQTLSGGTSSGDPDSNRISPIVPAVTPASIGPALDSPNLRSVFFPDPSAALLSPDKNRWFWDNAADAHYLPGATFPSTSTDRLFLFRGVDWSGDIAVTSPSGRFSLHSIRLFGQFGIRARNQSAPANVSNSYYYDDPSLAGVLMDDIDNSLPSPDDLPKGWDGGVNLDPLLTDLRSWRTYIRSLPRDLFFASGDASNPRDLVNRNTVNAGGSYTGSSSRFLYDVNGKDTNNDGVVVVDVQDDGTDFEVNNSDWIIYNSDPSNPKFVIFRLRGRANMNMSNASIMVGEGIACSENGLGVLFVKAHPEEEFTSTSGSSDAVFSANNLVVNRVAFWDLNTIGDAAGDTDYPAPADAAVYIPESSKPDTDFINRGQQNNYTTLRVENGQGCSQFVAPEVRFNNVRFIKCSQCDAPVLYDYGDLSITGTTFNTDGGGVAANAPRHQVAGTLVLGTERDSEANGQPTAGADGDDLNPAGGPDDEDGVVFGTLSAGETGTITVTVSGGSGLLNAWIDWNNDGSFGAGEQIATEEPVSPGPNLLSVPVPAGAAAGKTVAQEKAGAKEKAGRRPGPERFGGARPAAAIL